MAQIPGANANNQINAAAFAAKFQSKNEVHRFLSSEVMAYLPASHTMTVWHLRDLAQGKKKIIKSDRVRVYNVPQFEGLTISDFLQFAKVYPEVARALPPENEILKLPRQYVINVIYTLVGVPFETWVQR